MTRSYAIVSCDIVAHATEPDIEEQVRRVAKINEIVQRVILSANSGDVVWASGGDGGHIAVAAPNASEQIIFLVTQLDAWSKQTGVRIRITGHYGPAEVITGADGRTQLVGPTINLCGSLLAVAPSTGFIVTRALQEFLQDTADQEFCFHDPRHLHLKHFNVTEVTLVTLRSGIKSVWPNPSSVDRQLLSLAAHDKRAWDVIYYAKRLFQGNSQDREARDLLELALEGHFGDIAPRQSERAGSRISFLSALDPFSFNRFVGATELVERDNNEYLCLQGDIGDTMYYILRGQFTVIIKGNLNEANHDEDVSYLPLKFGPGDLIGELALALRTPRTATLQAITPVALLSINYQRLEEFFRSEETSETTRRNFENFLTSRVLDFVSNRASYAIWNTTNSVPSRKVLRSWQNFFPYANRISLRAREFLSSGDQRCQDPGLYILVAGALQRTTGAERDGIQLDADNLPVIYADFPDEFVFTFHQYRVLSEHAVVLHIEPRPFRDLTGADRERFFEGIKKSIAQSARFDVFFSYAEEDEALVDRWSALLETKSVHVYKNKWSAGRLFKREIASAIGDSLLFVPIITIAQIRKMATLDASWLEKECAYRNSIFDREYANIIPVRLTHDRGTDILDGVSEIMAIGQSDEAIIEKLCKFVHECRNVDRDIPHAKMRTEFRWPI